MSAIDELRRLLDEAGVEYKDRDMFGKHVFHWGEPLHGAMFTDGGEWTELVVENASPEQAIAATVGRDERESYDAGFASGIKATLQQLYGLLHEYPTLDEIEAWADSQWEEYE